MVAHLVCACSPVSAMYAQCMRVCAQSIQPNHLANILIQIVCNLLITATIRLECVYPDAFTIMNEHSLHIYYAHIKKELYNFLMCNQLTIDVDPSPYRINQQANIIFFSLFSLHFLISVPFAIKFELIELSQYNRRFAFRSSFVMANIGRLRTFDIKVSLLRRAFGA